MTLDRIIINLVMGIYLILFALAAETEDFRSCIVFKLVPMLGGISLLLIGLKFLNWI